VHACRYLTRYPTIPRYIVWDNWSQSYDFSIYNYNACGVIG
jgi:hypothetical protein